MLVQPDYEDMLKSLNYADVKYCIIGSFALAFHATPRYTKDMDILVEPTLANGKKIIQALNNFGFGELGLTPEDFTAKESIVQLGFEPVRIDLITSISGISFEDIWKNRVQGIYGQTKTYFISREHLIACKLNAGRPQDLLDVDVLRSTSSENKHV